MKLLTGIDLLEIARLKNAVEKHGSHFLGRIFTPAELDLCRGSYPSLAVRFSAKEAAAKALGVGIGQIDWKDVEILRMDSGAPLLILHNRALILSQKLGISSWSLSLSHTHEHAIAQVVALIETDTLS